MQIRLFITAFAVAALLPANALPQSLADVARAEEARRKTVKQKGKVYTNDDLSRTGDGSAPATPPATAGTSAPAKPATSGAGTKPPTAPDPRDEQYWKRRLDGAQQTLSRNKVLLAALESRVNALNTDFVNIDDPTQRTVIQNNLQIATAELGRIKQDIVNGTKAISDIQEEARKANVPPGWLR